MRIADLVGCELYDGDGVKVGGVHDVRFVADGPAHADGRPAYRVAALIVGNAAVGHRLGFRRGEMNGPWPLTWLFRRTANRSFVVDWDDIVRFERPRIQISRNLRELRTVAEEDR